MARDSKPVLQTSLCAKVPIFMAVSKLICVITASVGGLLNRLVYNQFWDIPECTVHSSHS